MKRIFLIFSLMSTMLSEAADYFIKINPRSIGPLNGDRNKLSGILDSGSAVELDSNFPSFKLSSFPFLSSLKALPFSSASYGLFYSTSGLCKVVYKPSNSETDNHITEHDVDIMMWKMLSLISLMVVVVLSCVFLWLACAHPRSPPVKADAVSSNEVIGYADVCDPVVEDMSESNPTQNIPPSDLQIPRVDLSTRAIDSPSKKISPAPNKKRTSPLKYLRYFIRGSKNNVDTPKVDTKKASNRQSPLNTVSSEDDHGYHEFDLSAKYMTSGKSNSP